MPTNLFLFVVDVVASLLAHEFSMHSNSCGGFGEGQFILCVL